MSLQDIQGQVAALVQAAFDAGVASVGSGLSQADVDKAAADAKAAEKAVADSALDAAKAAVDAS